MANRVLLKRSATANLVPSAGNLEYGELALNYNDGNLFFKDASNVVTILASTQFVDVTGNIETGSFFLGNGSQLSGINSFSSVTVSGESDVVASGLGATLTFVSGTGISISTDASNNSVTFSTAAADNAVESALYGDGGSMGYIADPVASQGDAGLIVETPLQQQDLGLIIEAAAVGYVTDGGFY